MMPSRPIDDKGSTRAGPHPARESTMARPVALARSLGTMVAYGFARGDVAVDLDLARRLGATLLEILPDWRRWPDPAAIRRQSGDQGLRIHSAHGCWGSRAIRADRVDLASPEPGVRRASVDDLKRCSDWLIAAGGRFLIVHPGGLSDLDRFEVRRAALAESLHELADHARGVGVVACVENMPPGVFPGSRMAELADLAGELGRPELGLTIDTGHANIVSSAAAETLAAGPWLRSTHVHDNNGHQDSHDHPGAGTIDWDDWLEALDEIRYEGPIMLECIRVLRQRPELIDDALLGLLEHLTRPERAP
jgi:sugar phosphate isomerase/epimerase